MLRARCILKHRTVWVIVNSSMSGINNSDLYEAHVEELQRRYDEALGQAQLDAVIVAAGTPSPIFLDDQHLPFKANPHLVQWAPLTDHPDTFLCYRRGETPLLLIYEPEDYWHLPARIPALVADGPIRVKIISDGMLLYEHAKKMPRKTAFIGEVRESGDKLGLRKINPRPLLDHLNYQRSFKTPWEVSCIADANRLAVQGHQAAQACFVSGGSEYDIHLAYRTASRVTDNEMPYPAIVALNEHGAALHYQHLDKEPIRNLSLLIDAGCSVNGYASDVTRTHSVDSEFAEFIKVMDELQRKLCEAAQPGAYFPDLHLSANHGIAELLRESGVIECGPEEAVENGLMRCFFPHGLGHFLGLQVHDVGALLADAAGHEAKAPESAPSLRLARRLEPGNVLTIEPGIYFIESLLAPLREEDAGKYVNWKRVAQMRRFGGIRIEDNLHITVAGNENLTRTSFAEAASN